MADAAYLAHFDYIGDATDIPDLTLVAADLDSIAEQIRKYVAVYLPSQRLDAVVEQGHPTLRLKVWADGVQVLVADGVVSPVTLP